MRNTTFAGWALDSTMAALALSSIACSQSHFPTGTYTTTLTRADLPPGVSAADSTTPGLGEWVVIFSDQGRVEVRKAGRTVVEADYKTSGDQLTISNETGPEACTEEGPGTYRWQTRDGALVMTALRDACTPRVGVFSKHPLVRAQR